ncbi:MAG: hypothetical protein BZY88_17845 [SAR202 cluster bacterium Io17-Chloro-G9]|nr:MAG: hypothetical protein BZY88_17845 [SAR202 cluster bacterium Io17-Chloro-G9]
MSGSGSSARSGGPVRSLEQNSAPRLLQDALTLRQVLTKDIRFPDPRGGKGAFGGPVLVALCGLPGTGKSHFARELLKKVALVVLETDRLRKVLVPKPKYTRGEHARVFRVCHLLIEEYLTQGQRVLFDATNLTEQARGPLYQIADRLGCSLALVGFTAPRDLVKQRLSQRVPGRNHGDFSDATWQIHCRMRPFEEAIQRPHIMVDTSQDISQALDQVLAMISNPHCEQIP